MRRAAFGSGRDATPAIARHSATRNDDRALPWPNRSPASSASPAAPSPANGPAAARPAASGTPSRKKPSSPAPGPAAKAPAGRAVAFVGLAGSAEPPPRAPIGIAELDRVLGGGLVPASAVLVGGDPGIGKSTLLLQAAARAGAGRRRVLYVSGEESIDQIRLRARRLGVADSAIELAAAINVRDIAASLEQASDATLVVIDSIQTMWLDSDRQRARHGGAGARRSVRADPARQGRQLRAGAGRPRHQGRRASPGRACWSTWSTRCCISKATAAISSASCAR